MTVMEHTKIETPKSAIIKSKALGLVHFTVGFPSVISAQRGGQTNHLRKHAKRSLAVRVFKTSQPPKR